MAKRIIVEKDDNKIEIWDNELESFEKKGFKKQGSEPIKQHTKNIIINKKEDK